MVETKEWTREAETFMGAWFDCFHSLSIVTLNFHFSHDFSSFSIFFFCKIVDSAYMDIEWLLD